MFYRTGQEDDRNGVIFVEFELLDEQGGVISLAAGDVEYIRRDGVVVTPNTQSSVWIEETTPAANYVYVVKTTSGDIYRAVLNWTP
ncbi:hypothetical protein [Paenibacillus sp. JJ-100]|uniref:hypothetical protein n=1 Tax=Paenibacillus sp. JJ-100 TaxID=2974896 RepID=UPI00232C8E63|nr:hypothetical protein [Paenibacillus sp. JJ-100]